MPGAACKHGPTTIARFATQETRGSTSHAVQQESTNDTLWEAGKYSRNRLELLVSSDRERLPRVAGVVTCTVV